MIGPGAAANEDGALGGESPCLAVATDGGGDEPDDRGLAQLVRDLAEAVVIADVDGNIVFWNGAATALFGWSALEVAGRSLDLIIPQRLRARHAAGYRTVMATGHTEYASRLLQVPAVHRDGHTFSIAFTVTLLHPVGQRTPTGIAAVIRDDTAARVARVAAAASR